jgi:phosphopentomutase
MDAQAHTLSALGRAIVIVLDSVGIGELPDAARYGDTGADTVGHLEEQIGLRVPTLRRLGLDRLIGTRTVSPHPPAGAWGRMAEASAGKDSVTGHWELMGLVLDRPFPVYPDGFPADVIDRFSRLTGRGVLGNRAASGTAIIDELGEEHRRTGKLIVYTSADSVFQIAAHEQVVPVAELYEACRIAYEDLVERLGVGRVIARPFVGTNGHFTRTANRRDFARRPPEDTLLDRLTAAGHRTIAIGKIEDLFAGRGIAAAYHTASDEEGMDLLDQQMNATSRGFIFVNLVDFDTVYGHRNDPAGYAANLERFDRRLASVLDRLQDDDLLIVTADHGNDPTTPGTDHTREYVPVFAAGPRVVAGTNLGTRRTFADVGQTLADMFGLPPLRHGTSFLPALLSGAA